MLSEFCCIRRQQSGEDGIETKCLVTLISSPYAMCGISSRKYIVLTKADIPGIKKLIQRPCMCPFCSCSGTGSKGGGKKDIEN